MTTTRDPRDPSEGSLSWSDVFPKAAMTSGRLTDTLPMLRLILEANPEPLMILNLDLKLMECNQALLDFLGNDFMGVVGRRPGEIFHCVNALQTEAGCGFGRACSQCGARHSITTAPKDGRPVSEECRIVAVPGGRVTAYDLRIWSKQVVIGQEPLILVVIKDISDEKRRKVLEQTFFHDILNQVGLVSVFAQTLEEKVTPVNETSLSKLNRYIQDVIDEIKAQRDLALAEDGHFQVSVEPIALSGYLREIAGKFTALAARNRVSIETTGDGDDLRTDRVLLGRIVGNLIKNALEASLAGDLISIHNSTQDGRAYLAVKNPRVIPESVQALVFQRSFSTKGKNRGVGTYSVKFFTENLLHGTVDFTSREGEGTVFTVSLPLNFPEPSSPNP